MKILVTDGETRAALAAVRSLAAAGHEIAIASSDTRPLAGASRSVNETHVLPDPHREPDAFQTALGGLVAGGGFDLVLPIAEITLALLYDVRGIERNRVFQSLGSDVRGLGVREQKDVRPPGYLGHHALESGGLLR